MLLPPFTFHAPSSLKEAVKSYAECDDARILAGGTFLLNSLKLFKKKGIKTPQNIISLRRVEELKGINLVGENLMIKSMTSVNDIFESPLLTGNLSILKTVCRHIATTPIRNMATIGGNLTCRYTWTELGTVLMALDAEMHFAGADGQEEIVKADEFFRNEAKTDKILVCISIKKDTTAVVNYQRVKKTLHLDAPLLALCVKTNLNGNGFTNTRVVINNGIAFAQRDNILEDFLNKASCSPDIPQEACLHLDTPIYEKRSDDYKKHMFRVSIKNALSELLENHKQ